MKTTTKVLTKKKIIDLKPEIHKILNIQAAINGMNLKAYIEQCLEEIANEDALLIELSTNAPGTDELLNEQEQESFLKALAR